MSFQPHFFRSDRAEKMENNSRVLEAKGPGDTAHVPAIFDRTARTGIRAHGQNSIRGAIASASPGNLL